MARDSRAKAITKGTRYVAEQALTALYDEYQNRSFEGPDKTFGQWAVERVWDVDYKPTAGRLVVVLDLNEPAEPLHASQPESDESGGMLPVPPRKVKDQPQA